MQHSWIIIAFLLSFAGTGTAQTTGSIDTDFDIVLAPVPTGNGILASLETTSLYPCAGYGIRSTVTWENDTISIHIYGMVQPSPCIQSGDAATGTAYLGDPGPGNYILRIFYRDEVDLHKVAFVPGEATTKPVRDHFSRVQGY